MVPEFTTGSLIVQPDRLPGKSMNQGRNVMISSSMRKLGFDPAGKTTEEKMKVLRKYREAQYESLVDAVYKRRGWNNNGVPKIEFLKKIGMDLPEVIDVVKDFQ